MNSRRKLPAKRTRPTLKKVKKTHFFKIGWLIVFLVFTVLLALFVLCRNFLAVSGKISVVFPRATGDVVVSIFDFDSGEITNIQIPGTTEVVASHHLGIWKVGSLWQLGTNEHLSGSLLKDSVVKNFHFPVMYWADAGFSRRESYLVSAGETNLPIKIKLAIALLSLRSKGSNRTDINLLDSSFLIDKKTVGGERGYSISAFVPDILVAKFSEITTTPETSEFVKVAIVDKTEVGGLAENVGKTVEMLGAKIVSVKKTSDADPSDCEVYGKSKTAGEKIAQIFGCKIDLSGSESSADVTITLGSSFGKRY